jgi:hypothetical protein
MNAVIKAMEREGEGEEIDYVGVAKSMVLMRPHSAEDTKANAQHVQKLHMRQKLNPKQEEELYKYINTVTERVL